MDPYKVLGVSRDASDAEIKKAYRALVKKYHPDQYGTGPMADQAAEKLKTINEAYDQINRERSGKSTGSGYSNYGGGYSGYGGYQANVPPEFVRIRAMIQANNLAQAEALLDQMNEHPAEWHFLKGIILMRKGFYDGARQHINTAYNMDPGNIEYQNAFNQMNGQFNGYRNFYGGTRSTEGDCCDICMCSMCMSSCCECFGGNMCC